MKCADGWKWFLILFALSSCHSFQVSSTGRPSSHYHDSVRLQRKPTTIRSAVTVGGLVEDFECLQVTHKTIKALRQDIPLLLYKPYTEETASQFFTLETEILFGKDDYVLANSREELISLQNALILAVQGPLRATNLLSRQNRTAPVINCKFKPQNENASVIIVEWDVRAAISNTNFSGISELQLRNGKVGVHRLRKVRLNGQSQDAETVGNALSRIRQTVRSLQQAQTIQSTIGPFGSILSQYRDDLMRQLDIVLPSKKPIAPIFFDSSNDKTFGTSNTAQPMPGTLPWECYARSHEAIIKFVDEIIPKLALAPSDAPFDLQELFAPDSEMFGLDGKILISGGPRLAKFYQSLASWRRRSLTTWTLVGANAVEWREGKPQVQISFVTDLPGSQASLAGIDLYALDLDPDSDRIRVKSVHQMNMSIGDSSKQKDLSLFMRGIVDFVENDSFANADEQWITDLWQRLRSSNKRNGLSQATSVDSDNKSKKQLKAPARSDAAAATVYRIMIALHNDGKDLVDSSILRNHPPALDFMIENVQLRGLLNEVIVRGRSSYQQSLGVSIGSLKSSIQGKRITSDKGPLTKVELTPSGNIRYTLTLFLKIETFAGIPNLLNIPSSGLPLKVELITEYILDPDSGRIVQHRLLESRLNDQLTPGDFLSRVLLRGQDGFPLDENGWRRVLTDVIGRLTNNRSL